MAPKSEPTLAHDLAARVAAWHNRHPFAQRITPAQVQGVGVVALPFLGANAAAAAVAAEIVGATAGTGEDTVPFALQAAASENTPLAVPDPADATNLPERAAARLQADGAGAAADSASPADPAANVTADIAPPSGSESAGAVAGLPAAPNPVKPLRWARLRAWRRLRRRVGAAARGAWVPAFSEDFIAPITPAQAARFALRHGLSQRSGDAGWPQRDVLADGPASPRQATVYLGTAAIEVGDRRLRVLVGGGPQPAVLGPRLWSRPRAGAAAALCLAGVATVLALRWPAGAPHETLAALPTLPASASSALAPASASSAPVALVLAAASAAGPLPASLSASAALPSPSSAPPADGPAEAASAAPAAVVLAAADPGDPPGRARAASSPAGVAAAPKPAASAAGAASAPAPFPDIRPRLSTEQRELARQQAEELRAQLPPRAGAAGGAARAATTAAVADGRVFALVTRTTRGRAASEVMQSLMVTAAAGATWPGQPRTEVLQVPQGWRAAWWPFGSPADAELAREALAVYGINAEIVEF